MVRSPGFEPGSSAWEADVLTKLDYDRIAFGIPFQRESKMNLNFCPSIFPVKKKAKLRLNILTYELVTEKRCCREGYVVLA